VTVARLVRLCVDRLPSCVTDDAPHSDTDGETRRGRLDSRHEGSISSSSGGGGGDRDVGGGGVSVGVVSTCLLTSLRLLLNMTHDNSQSIHAHSMLSLCSLSLSLSVCPCSSVVTRLSAGSCVTCYISGFPDAMLCK